jgi:hypothetical protein
MLGSRLINDRSFVCDSLRGMTIQKFLAYHEADNVEEITMIFLKLEEKELWQRFFLDASFGFWEEWDEEGSFDGFEDDHFIDLSRNISFPAAKFSI